MRFAPGLFVLLTLMTPAAIFAQGRQGIAPRRDTAAYSSQIEHEKFSIGISLLTEREVKNAFATPFDNHYLIVEVAVYPREGSSLKVSPDDFSLMIQGQDSLRPLDAATVAGQLLRDGKSVKGVDVYPVATASIGVSNYPEYDPRSGRTRNQTAVYTSTGIGVGVGPAGSGAGPDAGDRDVIRQELTDKSFPSTEAVRPVCGYLYFPSPDKKPKGDLLLESGVGGERFTLKLIRK